MLEGKEEARSHAPLLASRSSKGTCREPRLCNYSDPHGLGSTCVTGALVSHEPHCKAVYVMQYVTRSMRHADTALQGSTF